MTASDKDVREKIITLLNDQKFAVLSTQRDGQPYSSLMAFAHTSDLKSILIATGKSTRKHQNIMHESRVSLLIDNRSNNENDFQTALALTVTGAAHQVEADDCQGYWDLYINRHPYLEKFLNSPSTAFFKVMVDNYLLVSNFQDVTEYSIGVKSDSVI